MARNDNATRPTGERPERFIENVAPAGRRRDALALLDLFGRATGLAPILWGASIIGYGRYRYRYDSGRQGEFMLTGFSPRKAAMTIYIMPGFSEFGENLASIGPHKLGRSCLYLGGLSKIDLPTLERMVARSVEIMRARYECFDA